MQTNKKIGFVVVRYGSACIEINDLISVASEDDSQPDLFFDRISETPGHAESDVLL